MPNNSSTESNSGQDNILLESGTNELEVLVFTLGKTVYGVNVAKVREVILPVKTVASPDQPDAVLGMFNLRNRIMPLVDLHRFLEVEPADANPKNRKIIVMEFNGNEAAFQVETVDQIYRISWSKMEPLPDIHGGKEIAVTGITRIKDRLLMMLDFESIFDAINIQQQLHIDKVDNVRSVDRAGCRVLFAEDSNFIRTRVQEVLANSGFCQVSSFSNGYDAWKALQTSADDPENAFNVIISDIEMPRMDGLALTRNIKSDPKLKQIPVILFSSLITPDTLHKGKQVGADNQIAKPQLGELVELIDGWIQPVIEKAAS